MVSNAGLLLRFGYGFNVIDRLPSQGTVHPPGGISGTYYITGLPGRDATGVLASLEPAKRAGLKGNYKAQEGIFEVLAPDFVMTQLTENEVLLSPDELEAWIRGDRTGTPPEGLEEEKAYFRVDSEPAGGRVWIDNIDTGHNTWTPKIEVLPGMHKVEVRGLEGYVDTQIQQLAVAGETKDVVVTMAPLPPDTPPPPPPPPTEPFTGLGQLFELAFGQQPAWYQAIDDFIRFATEQFGTDFTKFLTPEERAKFQEADISSKILFIGGPMNLQQVTGTNVGKQTINLAAAQIKEMGLSDKPGLFNAMKALTPELRRRLFAALDTTSAGRGALKVIQENWLANEPLSLLAQIAKHKLTIALTLGTGVTSGALWYSFLGFPFEEADQRVLGALVGLVNNDQFEDAAEFLPEAEEIMGRITGSLRTLRAVPLIGDLLGFVWGPEADAADLSFRSIKTQIAEGLEEEAAGTTISVTTVPTQALASIAAVFLEKVTPFTANIAPGRYDLRIEKEGFSPRTVTAIIKENQNNPITVELSAIPPDIAERAGRLEIAAYAKKTGTPILASFFVNDRLEKGTAHAIVLDMVPGAYEIRVEAAGFKPFLDTIVVDEGVTTVVKAELEKPTIVPPPPPPPPPPPDEIPPEVPEKGRLEVTANTAADIYIGGVKQGKKTPASFDLTQGIYSITLKAEGFKDRTTTTLVKSGEPTVVSLQLQESEAPPITIKLARLSIQSEPSGAKITVNGVWTKKYTPDSVLLEAGDYEISLTKSGFKTWRTPLRLTEES